MPTTKRTILSISLPKKMVKDVERACKLEQRTRSELMREALRFYLHRIPVFEPTRDEIAAFERGRGEHARSEYVTLEELEKELDHDMEVKRRSKRTKKIQKVSRQR